MMLIYMDILDDDEDIDDNDDDGISLLYMLHSFTFIDDTVSIRVCWISEGHDSHCVDLCWQGRILMMLDRSWVIPIGRCWCHMHSVSPFICIIYNMIGG